MEIMFVRMAGYLSLRTVSLSLSLINTIQHSQLHHFRFWIIDSKVLLTHICGSRQHPDDTGCIFFDFLYHIRRRGSVSTPPYFFDQTIEYPLNGHICRHRDSSQNETGRRVYGAEADALSSWYISECQDCQTAASAAKCCLDSSSGSTAGAVILYLFTGKS